MRRFNLSILGFTLVEVMIVVAILGILVAVGYPSYTNHVTASNRTEGQRELLRVANLMEQFFLDQRVYTANMTNLGLSADPYISVEGGYYSIDAVIANGGQTYTLTATAIGSQATADTACPSLQVNEAGFKTSLNNAICWGQ